MAWRKTRLGAGIVLLACALGLGMLYYAGSRDDPGVPSDVSKSQTDTPSRLDQGRYLATLGNCVGCHTAPGGTSYAGGTEIRTDFGTLYGPNITPHQQEGIGSWNSDEFYNALHNGRGPDGTYL
ncbi:MAG: cytochrome c, partial [Comamonadaceae bacterium]